MWLAGPPCHRSWDLLPSVCVCISAPMWMYEWWIWPTGIWPVWGSGFSGWRTLHCLLFCNITWIWCLSSHPVKRQTGVSRTAFKTSSFGSWLKLEAHHIVTLCHLCAVFFHLYFQCYGFEFPFGYLLHFKGSAHFPPPWSPAPPWLASPVLVNLPLLVY